MFEKHFKHSLLEEDVAETECFSNSIGGKQAADTIWSILGRGLSNRSTAGASFTLCKVHMGPRKHKQTCSQAHSWESVGTRILDPFIWSENQILFDHIFICNCLID